MWRINALVVLALLSFPIFSGAVDKKELRISQSRGPAADELEYTIDGGKLTLKGGMFKWVEHTVDFTKGITFREAGK